MPQPFRRLKRAAIVFLSAGMLLQVATCSAFDVSALTQSVLTSLVSDFVYDRLNVPLYP